MKTRTTGKTDARPSAVVVKPPFEDWPDAGVYQLHLRLSRRVELQVGKLGRFVFPAGRYLYTGRASRGLRARVLRHIRGGRRKHWHIDYLLAHPATRLEAILLAATDAAMECAVNQASGARALCIARGFGASDCKGGCSAHLWWFDHACAPRAMRTT